MESMSLRALAALLSLTACGGNEAAQSPTSSPLADGEDVVMTLAVEGSKLLVTLTNRSERRLTIARRVHSGAGPHVDWLTVELDGPGGRRALRFSGDRTRSDRVLEAVAPGSSFTESVDLVSWAIRAGNGDPLQPGSYAVRATWDAKRERAAFMASAATSMIVAAPRAPCTAEEARLGARIELLARQLSGPGVKLQVGFHNVHTDPVCLYTHVVGGEFQSDWLSVHLPADGDRVIRFVGDRNRAAPVTSFLPPGATVWQTWDLEAWAARPANGGRPLPARRTLGASVAFKNTAPDVRGWAWYSDSWIVLTLP